MLKEHAFSEFVQKGTVKMKNLTLACSQLSVIVKPAKYRRVHRNVSCANLVTNQAILFAQLMLLTQKLF